MRLFELFSKVKAGNRKLQELNLNFDSINGLQTDSRKVRKGNLFIALTGSVRDGHDYVAQAFANGAVLAFVERPVAVKGGQAVVVVENLRHKVGEIAAKFFGEPTKTLKVIGITGTNGKTTTASICHQILSKAGFNPSLVGTIGTVIDGQSRSSTNTTPGAIELQQIAAETLRAGGSALIMEVSSHGLEQGRVAGVNFDVAVFTNLTQDHLDYHGTFANYRLAKGRLFEMLDENSVAILNDKDPASDLYQKLTSGSVQRFGFDPQGAIAAQVVGRTLRGSELLVSGLSQRTQRLLIPFIGNHNIENCLAAMAACVAVGARHDKVFAGLERCQGIPGRLERVSEIHEPAVFIDYAHTDDALENVLRTLRPLTKGRLSVVFGCGGDRDQGKRPKMGQAAARWADQLIITSDNPRSEDPEKIIKQILQGLHSSQRSQLQRSQQLPCHVEIDRKAAIEWAIRRARRDDVVLIAGKGHEQTQVFAENTIQFCDRQSSKQALATLAHRSLL